MTLEERFWSKVKKGAPDECWEQHTKSRYGKIYDGNKVVLLHRVSWLIFVGEIPEGMEVCHKCDNPRCCNPSHLFIGTHADNMRDMANKGRCRVPALAGGDNPSAKLTGFEVSKIRELFCSKQNSMHQLASMFHVSRRNISEIVRNLSWKDETYKPPQDIYWAYFGRMKNNVSRD